VRQFGPWRSPARAGAGQHVEEQRRLQSLVTRGRLPAHRKATEAGDRPSRWVGCAKLAAGPTGAKWGQSGRWTSKSATKCNELRWSFPARRRVSSGLEPVMEERAVLPRCVGVSLAGPRHLGHRLPQLQPSHRGALELTRELPSHLSHDRSLHSLKIVFLIRCLSFGRQVHSAG
jgi:hypothetical protein